MSNEEDFSTDDDKQMAEARLGALKERATALGIKFHPSIGEEKLQEKINEAMAADDRSDTDGDDDSDSGSDPVSTEETPTSVGEDSAHSDDKAPKEESPNQLRLRKQKEASELIRIRVTCMDPAKKDYEGEIFCAGNRVIGTFKKYVPFNQEYHVPRILYNMIKDKQCQIFITTRDEKRRNVTKGKMIKAYSVEVLDPLTPTELKELAQRQAMAKGTSAA